MMDEQGVGDPLPNDRGGVDEDLVMEHREYRMLRMGAEGKGFEGAVDCTKVGIDRWRLKA